MRTQKDFLVDVLRQLNEIGIDYMLTGAMASSYWGIPRTTHGADFVLALTPGQTERFIAGFGHSLVKGPDAANPNGRAPFFCVSDEQSALWADFWLLSGSGFERVAFDRRRTIELWNVPAWIITAEDILLHKLHRNQIRASDWQLQDVAGIYAMQAERLEFEYLHWSEVLKVEREWQAVVRGEIRLKST